MSGSIVEDPSQYEGRPDLTVVRFAVPAQAAEGTAFGDWMVEAPGANPQSLNKPVTFTVPAHAQSFDIVLRPSGASASSVRRSVKISPSSAKRAARQPAKYQAEVLCIKDDICQVSGAFTGDSSKTFAAWGETPAPIVAETHETAFIGVPQNAVGGPQYLLVTENSKLLAFPVLVAEVTSRADDSTLTKGGMSMVFFTVVGPGDLSDSQWSGGVFPASNLARARTLVPGFKMPHEAKEEHEAREANEKKSGHDIKEGFLLVVAQDTAPDIASFHGAKNGQYVFKLTSGSFKTGRFVYKFIAEASKDGTYGVKATLIPFLAPVAAQEFPLHEGHAAASGR